MDDLGDFARLHSPDAVMVFPVASANKTPTDWPGCPTNEFSGGRCILAMNACDPLNSITDWATENAADEIATLNDFPRESVYWP